MLCQLHTGNSARKSKDKRRAISAGQHVAIENSQRFGINEQQQQQQQQKKEEAEEERKNSKKDLAVIGIYI